MLEIHKERSKSLAPRSKAKGRQSRRRFAVGRKTAILPASHQPFQTFTMTSV